MAERILVVFTLVCVLVGCGSSGSGDGDPGASEGNLTLSVPAEATGVPRQLVVILTDSWPVAGPPRFVLLQDTDPAIVPGTEMPLSLDTEGIEGRFYLVSVLYMEGGGTWTPEPGIDFQGHSPEPLTFDGSAMSLGHLELEMTE